MDLYWIYELVDLISDLAGIVDAMLPEGTSAEDDGTGGGQAGDDNFAIRRYEAKRNSEAARTEARVARKKTSAVKRCAEFQKATQAGMANAFKEVTPPLENLTPKPFSARSRMEEGESKSARLAYLADLRASYKSCAEEIAALKAKGGGADDFYLGCLLQKLEKINKSMQKVNEDL